MPDLKERLLPPKPASAINLRDPSYRPSASGRQPFNGVDFLGLKKRGQGLRSWIRVDALGNSQVIEVDKFTMMRRCDLPPRDLRLLDPLFVYPSTILGREKAIVVNLEQIRCIITADEVFVLNSLDNYVLQYVVELERRLKTAGAREVWQSEGTDLSRRRGSRSFDNMFGSMSPDYLPFEFRALEVALESACTFLDSQAAELEIEAYPLLDEFTSKISTLNLERVRRLKSRLVALTRRVQKVRDEIEQLMDDDGDMAEMYLTEKKRRTESVFCGDQSLMGYRSTDGMQTASAPVSPVPSPRESRKLEKSLSIIRSQHESIRSTESTTESIEELEMLLEAYFVVIDSTLNKLTSLKEYIDDTEDFINIHLDNVRNQLILDPERANKLLEEGHFFKEKAREADEKSAKKFLETREEDVVSLDLHEQDPKEAISLLRIHLSSLSGIPSIEYLKIIVGANAEDSKEGARKRRVMKLLEKESIKWSEERNGRTIVVRLNEIDPKGLSFAKKSSKKLLDD